MKSPTNVPVVDVHGNNFKELWGAMTIAMKTSSFFAIDTELSGLGSRKALLAESIEDRYKAICQAARTRSVLSLGLACFQELPNKADTTYLVQVYNLTLLCTDEYVIEPKSVQFLVQHGFDFNKQYSQGIPYYKGNDKQGDVYGVNMRSLFVELLRLNKPLVVHNGLIDMVFLYQCFYGQLPDQLGTFVADLSQMFPSGIFDTKYATEYELRYAASYLEYAYKKCKLENSRASEADATQSQVILEFCNYAENMQSFIDYRPCLESQDQDDALAVCLQFSAYGWCPNGPQCSMSHDTDLIILQDEKNREEKRKKRKRRKNKKKEQSEMCGSPVEKKSHLEDSVPQADQDGMAMSDPTPPGPPSIAVETSSKSGKEDPQPEASSQTPPKTAEKKVDCGTHRAGFDAFMTGYIFAHTRNVTEKTGPQSSSSSPVLPECLNKLYLSGKSVPLHVTKSSFSRFSKLHDCKKKKIWGDAMDTKPENPA